MAATATATTTAMEGIEATAAATTTEAAAGQSAAIPEKYMHKNRLQEFAVRTQKKLPIYNVEREGEYHHPKFRCTVEVGGQKFSSTGSFSRKKEAEQDAARVAYEILAPIEEGDVNKEVFGLIDQDVVFCKSILYEFAVKTKTARPSYSEDCLKEPFTMFVGSVVFDGNTYTGESASNKKDAQQNAARAVIKSILATGGPDHVAPASQDESSSLGVQEHSIVPAVGTSANPSAKAVSGSKKRKGRVGGADVNGTMVAKEH
uniref:DRBM domain-containing protein n=1 Tax=Setaria italica TaxID=4555 RepID=K3YJ81_SETIT